MQSSSAAPQAFGLPPQKELMEYEIWDSYFTPSFGSEASRVVKDIERTLPTIDKASIQRLCIFLHVGLGTTTPATDARIRANLGAVIKPLQRWPNRLLGMIQLNANDVRGSLSAVDRWLRDGPMVGVYFPGGPHGSLTCSHRNFDPLIKRIAELDGVIMQHTWFKTGGKDSPGESTPTDLAQLAAVSECPFRLRHAGGEWEKGIRAIRSSANILAETSGFDPTAGFIDMAVRELGPERVVFGSHLPSRSLGTELGKIIGSQTSKQDRQLILGENLRRLLAPILRNKGIRTDQRQ